MYPTVDILDAEPWELGFQIHQDFLWNIWISLNFYGVFHQDTESLLPTSSSPCLPFSGTAKPKGSAEMRWQHTALLAFGWKVNRKYTRTNQNLTYTWQKISATFGRPSANPLVKVWSTPYMHLMPSEPQKYRDSHCHRRPGTFPPTMRSWAHVAGRCWEEKWPHGHGDPRSQGHRCHRCWEGEVSSGCATW